MSRLATTALPWRELDADTSMLLREGDRHGRYASQSEVAMSLAVRFRNHGRTLDEFLDALTDSANASSQWWRELRDGRASTADRRRKSARGRAKATAELRRCWAKAGRLPPPRHLDIADLYERCERARAYAERTLTGQTRATRTRALDVVLARARRHRSVQVLASDRGVAVEAGMHRNTARRCLADLCAIGVLRRLETTFEVRVVQVEACSEIVPGLPHCHGVRYLAQSDYTRGAT